jgi:hypothetical protein
MILEKRVNLTGDVSAYLAWFSHVRTEARDVAVLYLRRRYIPPAGDTFQDMIFRYTGKVNTIPKRSVFFGMFQKVLD